MSRHRLLPGIGLAAVLAAAGLLALAFWPRGVDNLDVVVPNQIYRSGQPADDQRADLLRELNLRTVLSLRETNAPPDVLAAEADACARHGVRLVNVPMPGDGLGDFEAYDRALALLTDPETRPVLVHCARGSYRTGGVIAAYRLLIQGWSEADALSEMRAHRFTRRADHPLLAHLRAYVASRKNRILSVDSPSESR
jgi:protein tyrosine/serine phosphatase